MVWASHRLGFYCPLTVNEEYYMLYSMLIKRVVRGRLGPQIVSEPSIA